MKANQRIDLTLPGHAPRWSAGASPDWREKVLSALDTQMLEVP